MSSMADHDAYRIALYYCYIPIPQGDDAERVVTFHQQFEGSSKCLGGRIRIAPEGLNGVLSGPLSCLEAYETDLRELLSAISCSTSSSWELDVKYCRLRPELPVEPQLFDTWVVQRTQHVVGLVSSCCRTEPSPGRRKQKATPKVLRQEEAIYHESLRHNRRAPHLSPEAWNEKLQQTTAAAGMNNKTNDVLLIDCRNAYESDIGHFQVPGATTLLTNTRKYAELATILLEQKERIQAASHVFMYCTGGVRCERASGYLETMLTEEKKATDETTPEEPSLPEIYQLHGGIQRYLEHTNTEAAQAADDENCTSDTTSFYHGKNFVFDPRRTDPLVGRTAAVVGRCRVCQCPHDDYDNGASPTASHPARCCRCRVLLLVCPACRATVHCWGDDDDNDTTIAGRRPQLLCGDNVCVHRPPPREIRC